MPRIRIPVEIDVRPETIDALDALGRVVRALRDTELLTASTSLGEAVAKVVRSRRSRARFIR